MTTATPAIAINDSRKPELAITYGFFNISIIADNDTAERISYLLPSTCAFTAHTNITIARVADTELPVITPNNTTNIPLIIADIGQRKPILRNSLYSPMPISDMWRPVWGFTLYKIDGITSYIKGFFLTPKPSNRRGIQVSPV